MLGVPDMGKVCAECHVPNYVDYAQQLRDVGVDDIICVAVAPAEKAEAWGKKIDLKDSKVTPVLTPNLHDAQRHLLGIIARAA
jgi:peroxiredoxin